MRAILDNVGKYLFFWIVAIFLLGLTNVYFFGGFTFTPLICVVAALVMIYPSLVPLSFDKLPASLKHYPVILMSVFVNFILFPILAYTIGALFLADEPVLRLGMILLALLPGGGMVTTWAMKSKADMPTTIGIVIVNLFVAIIAVPLGISYFLHAFDLGTPDAENALHNTSNTLNAPYENCVVEQVTNGLATCDFGGGGISALKIALPIFVIVIIPLLAAYGTQKFIKHKKGEEYFANIKSYFGKFSNLGLLLVLGLLMSLENNKIIFENPMLLAQIFVPLTILYAIGLGMILLLRKLFPNPGVNKAFVWGSYLRYITLALGIAISLVFQDGRLATITTVIIVSYFIQIPSSFVLAKFLQKK